ncbi:MAG TPA: HDOD domain-containing protein [Anaerolineaceae bacterium]|nr:HDOD domain-containing protein [Anaerolineaceae bacterium]
MKDYFLARQPIYDRQLKVIGYELLYRRQETSAANVVDRDLATTQVILNAYAETGFQRIVGKRLAFINLTDNFILGRYPLPFTPDKAVLEVPEDLVLNQRNITGLQNLTTRGFKLALDDVISMDISPLLGLTTVVKVDLMGTDRRRLQWLVDNLRGYPVLLLAEKIETQEDFELCLRMGFQYFQGFFLCKPNITRGHLLRPNRLVLMNLLGQIYQSDVEINRLEEIVAQDVSLGYKILRLVNSAQYGISTTITSIHQAIAMIGLEPLRGWLTLLLLSNTVDKPEELTIIAMLRAKMCELLARRTGQRTASSFFLVGLLSVLDALMDLPMTEVLDHIPLSKDITDALFYGAGRPGEALKCVLAYERGDWDRVCFSGLSANQIREIYLDAVDWAENISHSVVTANAAPAPKH